MLWCGRRHPVAAPPPVEFLGRIDWDDLDDDAVTTLVKNPRTILEITDPALVALGDRAEAVELLPVTPSSRVRRSRSTRSPAVQTARSDERLCEECFLWKNVSQFDGDATSCREHTSWGSKTGEQDVPVVRARADRQVVQILTDVHCNGALQTARTHRCGMTAGSGHVKTYRTNRVTRARIEVHDTTHAGYPEPVRSDRGKWRVACVTRGDRSPTPPISRRRTDIRVEPMGLVH